jgi:hypothetical protein
MWVRHQKIRFFFAYQLATRRDTTTNFRAVRLSSLAATSKMSRKMSGTRARRWGGGFMDIVSTEIHYYCPFLTDLKSLNRLLAAKISLMSAAFVLQISKQCGPSITELG